MRERADDIDHYLDVERPVSRVVYYEYCCYWGAGEVCCLRGVEIIKHQSNKGPESKAYSSGFALCFCELVEGPY